MQIPPKAKSLICSLNELFGAELFLVGGAVRNILLQKPITDWDFSTPTKPQIIGKKAASLNLETDLKGIEFGTVAVYFNGDKIEITTFRDEQYKPNNRNPKVTFIQDLKSDLERRDFTINSMAINSQFQMIDYFGGKQDLEDKLIRSLGNVEEKMTQDPVRILRAIRLAIDLNFKIEDATLEAMKKAKIGLKDLQIRFWERELFRFITSPEKGKSLVETLTQIEALEFMPSELIKLLSNLRD